jgi:hypothetical protein
MSSGGWSNWHIDQGRTSQDFFLWHAYRAKTLPNGTLEYQTEQYAKNQYSSLVLVSAKLI